MTTAALFGPPGPAFTSLTSILEHLNCRVLYADRPGRLERMVQIDLAVAIFRPSEMSLTTFAGWLRDLRPLPTLVFGPELPARLVNFLLEHGGLDHDAYLALNAPVTTKRAAFAARLRQASPSELVVGPLRLNPTAGRAVFHGQELPLSAPELRVLSVLMGQPGKAFGGQELEGECHQAQTHVHSLLRKLNAIRPQAVLRRVPGGHVIDGRRSSRTTLEAGTALKHHLLKLT